MIEHVTGDKYSEIFADIYNDAIELFAEDQRGTAAADVFIPQLENDENFIEKEEDGGIAAFMSYHQYGNYYELTSLYVKKEYQRKGIGQKLLCHMERSLNGGEVVFVKVLKNAPWSLEFYRSNGYMPLDARLRECAEALNIAEKPWSLVLCKRINSETA